MKPPAKLPHVGKGDHSNRLDLLFKALKAAPDDTTAKAIEIRIWATWMMSPSDTANLLMQRVREAIEGKDLKLAVKLLDAIIKIKPSYVEAWNQRATIYYKERQYGRAISDIGQVLKREPRHFGALSGLGLIYQDIGDDKEALEAYRRALKVYPRLQRIPDMVKKLSEESRAGIFSFPSLSVLCCARTRGRSVRLLSRAPLDVLDSVTKKRHGSVDPYLDPFIAKGANLRRSSMIKRLAVITGDHHRPDSTKLGGAWGPQDLEAHQKMVEALESLGRFEISVIRRPQRAVRAHPERQARPGGEFLRYRRLQSADARVASAGLARTA